KKIGDIFNNSSNSPNRVKLFVASSDFERDIIKQYFGYEEEKIVISGLARWDYLMDKSKGRSEILLMPTFRNWLEEVSESTFEHSTYFKEYSSLLKSDILSDFLLKSGTRLNFYLHPKLSNFIDMFSINNPNINIVRPGDKKINELIMQSSLLITDYSSVSVDFAYMKKPVVYYQFDKQLFFNSHYSKGYFSYEEDGFGPVFTDENDLITYIKMCLDNNFEVEKIYDIRMDRFFSYRDKNNNKRIFESIKNLNQD
ncbi:CDP-glycerol glycerophosphotransferase family protein, partial [Paenibacillus dendritiformis]|uniref:CDP-glycerol glycerophosphotransferase family protein n=1 Tax=Paenibacillus dendritiformis TaxID=130049 RepID=UPI00155F6E67